MGVASSSSRYGRPHPPPPRNAPPKEGELVWTKRLVKGWYAMAYYEADTPHGHGKIRVNVLLDSPDVSEETMRFLLWHEYLHLYLKAGHSKTFRELERK